MKVTGTALFCMFVLLAFVANLAGMSRATAAPPQGTPQWTGQEPLQSPYDHATHGIWLNYYDLMNPTSHPTSGTAWNAMYQVAVGMQPGAGIVGDQNSDEDVQVMAAALVAVRTNDAAMKADVADALYLLIGTEHQGDGDWLSASRNLTAYTIAADVLKMDGTWAQQTWSSKLVAFDEWLHDLLDGTTLLIAGGGEGSVLGDPRKIIPFASGSNAASQEGLCYIAMSAYFREYDRLAYGWERFRVLVGDRPVTNPNTYGPQIGVIRIEQGLGSGWAGFDPYKGDKPINATGIYNCDGGNPPVCYELGGCIINDHRRGGSWKVPPGNTNYPWTGIQGIMPAAVILHRFGYDALNAGDAACARMFEAQARLDGWFTPPLTSTGTAWWDYDRAMECKHLFSKMYAEANPGLYPYETPVDIGKTVGFTDWTHPL